MKKRYLVDITEHHLTTYSVMADSPEEAAQRVADGEGDYIDSEIQARDGDSVLVVSDDLPTDYASQVYEIADRKGITISDGADFISQAEADGLSPEEAVEDWIRE